MGPRPQANIDTGSSGNYEVESQLVGRTDEVHLLTTLGLGRNLGFMLSGAGGSGVNLR